MRSNASKSTTASVTERTCPASHRSPPLSSLALKRNFYYPAHSRPIGSKYPLCREFPYAPGRIRTCDRQLRRLLLCPTELRAPSETVAAVTDATVSDHDQSLTLNLTGPMDPHVRMIPPDAVSDSTNDEVTEPLMDCPVRRATTL